MADEERPRGGLPHEATGWAETGGGIDVPPPDDPAPAGLVRLALLAVVGGALAGLVGGLFRLALGGADVLRTSILEWTREAPAVRFAVPVLLAAVAVGVARWIVRWSPESSGSGVQRVEAGIRAEVPPPPVRVLPAKFVGGVLAIGAGLALGREGPTVQMGATIGGEVSRLSRLSGHDTRTLTASLAGAGLGVAFSAPMGGALFVFEEVARAFRTRLVVATLAGTAAALAVSRLLVGPEPDFLVPPVGPGPVWTLALYAVLGLALGAMAVAYNRLVIRLLDLFGAVRSLPPEVKAALIGAVVGAIGVVAPSVVGGGDGLNEEILLAGTPLGTVALVLVVRWVLGPLSYSAGTPGGLFAPLLVVGAAAGALTAGAVNAVLPAAGLSVTAFAIVGMSTFFAGVVRAPVTGVVLIMEMTATTSLVVPMALAAACAVVTATLLKGPPIYETLRLRMKETS